MSEVKGIKQCCALAKERSTESGSTKYIAAYYVADALGVLSEDAIIEQLSDLLPEYMLPSIFIEFKSFPLTINGKLDKKALPEPDFIASDDQYTAPSTSLEHALCEVWEKVLLY